MINSCVCEFCGKSYASRSAKSVHKKKYHSEATPTQARICILKAKIAAFTMELMALESGLQSISSTASTNSVNDNTTNNNMTNNTTNNSNIDCNNTTNNNTTNTHSHNTTNTNSHNTVNININIFRNEDTSYITGDRIKQLNSNEDLNESLWELIRMTYFNEQHPENMTAFLPKNENLKNVAMTHGKKGWVHAPIKQVAEAMTFDAGSIMLDHIQDNEEMYKERQLDKFGRWYDTIGKVKSIFDGTEKVIKDNSHIVQDTFASNGLSEEVAGVV